MLVAAVTYTSSTPSPGAAALLPTLGAVLVVARQALGEDDDPLGVGGLLAHTPSCVSSAIGRTRSTCGTGPCW